MTVQNDRPVLDIQDLNISFPMATGTIRAVTGVNLTVSKGEIVAIVGESGSGKSVTSRSILGLHPRSAVISGQVLLDGQNTLAMTEDELNTIRGKKVAMVFQEPSRALNPVFTIGSQMIDILRTHQRMSRHRAKNRVISLLDLVGIPEPEHRIGYYPHQLSGGQKQRVMIAMALCCEPDIIVADEPTTALDVTVQAEILTMMRELRDRLGTTILIITHNMGVVAEIADRVAVMHNGKIVENAPVFDLFANPAADYTRRLLAAVPQMKACAENGSTEPSDQPPVLQVSDLTVRFSNGIGKGYFNAVESVSFALSPAKTLAIVGESGSGKSTIARTIAGLQTPFCGQVTLQGIDVFSPPRSERDTLRTCFGYVFQDPFGSLNPYQRISKSILAPLANDKSVTNQIANDRLNELLDAVRLPQSVADKYPHQLSGGQIQRISIARALIRKPALLIADEPTSALDVSVQDQVLTLIKDLQTDFGFACLFITHDLAVASSFADTAVVMQKGRIVEQGPATRVLGSPQEDYTRRLVAAVPIADPTRQRARRNRLSICNSRDLENI